MGGQAGRERRAGLKGGGQQPRTLLAFVRESIETETSENAAKYSWPTTSFSPGEGKRERGLAGDR